jgi:hypothetical protein
VTIDDASILRKRRARGRADPTVRTATNWAEYRETFAAALATANIRAVVLDYDGTVVPTHKRLGFVAPIRPHVKDTGQFSGIKPERRQVVARRS